MSDKRGAFYGGFFTVIVGNRLWRPILRKIFQFSRFGPGLANIPL